MMKGNVRVVMLAGLLAVFCLAIPGDVQAKKPELENKNKKHYWVHRRDSADKDARDATAVVMQLEVTEVGEILKIATGKIWYYKGYDTINGKSFFNQRQPAIEVTGSVTLLGAGPRKREQVELFQKGASIPIANVTLYRGSQKPSNPEHRRTVFRWSPPSSTLDAKLLVGDCPKLPEDDPMEEEPLTPDMGTPDEPPAELADTP